MAEYLTEADLPHDNLVHTTAENYEHFLSYMYGSGARHSALLCKAYFDGSDAPHEEYEAYMEDYPEQAEQEPVAWMWRMHGWSITAHGKHRAIKKYVDVCKPPVETQASGDFIDLTPLYAAPVRTKDLTDDEIGEIYGKFQDNLLIQLGDFARAVVAKDREKNSA